MKTILYSTAFAALFLASAEGLIAQSNTWHVRKHPPTTNADGSLARPFNSLADAEKGSKAGDTIMVMATDETHGPLDGGITLKPNQKLLGMGAKVTTVPPPKTRAWITNTTTAGLGDAVKLADNTEVAGIHISGTRRCAVLGTNVTGTDVHSLLVTDWNTSNAPSTRGLFGSLFRMPGVYYFMLGNDTTRRSNRCSDCTFDRGTSQCVLQETHNKTRAELLVEGCRVLSANWSAIEAITWDTAEGKLVVHNCSIDNVAMGHRGIGAWAENQTRLDLEVDGLTFESTNKLQPVRGIEMMGNSQCKLVFRVENSTIRDCAEQAILALSYNNTANLPADLDCHIANNRIDASSHGIGCGSWLSGDLAKFRASILGNTINATGDGIQLFCGNNGSTVDDAVVTIDDNRVSGGARGIVYDSEGFATINMMVTDNIVRNISGAGIWTLERGSAPKGSVIFANNVVSGCQNAGIESDGGAPVFINNTSVDNGAYGILCTNSAARFSNGILWGNKTAGVWSNGFPKASVTHSAIQSAYPGTGNITADPRFVDAANGDYHLRHDSPCRNQGSNADVPASLRTDFEGDPRVADTTVDMGADEFFTHLYFTGTLSPGGSAKVNAIGDPSSTVVLGISAMSTVHSPGIAVPGLLGLLYLKDPMLILPMNKTASTGHSGLSLKVPAAFPTVDVLTQALIGSRFSNLAPARIR